jgi:hypothetical protein
MLSMSSEIVHAKILTSKNMRKYLDPRNRDKRRPIIEPEQSISATKEGLSPV